MKTKLNSLIALASAALMATTAVARAEPSAELIAAAEGEGQLTTIALPHDWCGYGAVIDSFKKKYPKDISQRTEPGCRFGRRSRSHQGQQGQQGPAGA